MIKHESTVATLPRTSRGSPLVLGGDPKGKNILYTNGNSVIIRNLREPNLCDIYTEHSFQTTVAKYSPSGFYICSGDVTGKIRIWDTIGEEHILKAEYQPFIGIIKDIAWSHDSQRLIVVGEGREKFGHVINMDTGTSIGEIMGHSKTINTCDFRGKRPFKIITGSDDNLVGVYEGPPFKFKHQIEHHLKYVQSLRFSPDGNLFASGGFDGKLFIYKNEQNEKILEMSEHKGGIYGVSWNHDSTKVMTCSGDKTVKVFDVNAGKVEQTFEIGASLQDQQVGCLWQDDLLLSVSLSGFINYFNLNESKAMKVIKGHNKPITALAVGDKTMYTGGCDGTAYKYNLKQKDAKQMKQVEHTNQITALVLNKQRLYSLGYDDSCRIVDLKEEDDDDDEDKLVSVIKLDSQPKDGVIVEEKQLFIVATYNSIIFISTTTNSVLETLPIAYETTSIARGTNKEKEEELIFVGGKDKKVHVYKLVDGPGLVELTTLPHRDSITCLSVSPDGAYLASGDANRKICLYQMYNEFKEAIANDWVAHTATVNAISWNGDSTRLVSGSLDTSIIVWNKSEPMKHVAYRKAHPLSQVTKIHWLNDERIISTGHDSNIKSWIYI